MWKEFDSLVENDTFKWQKAPRNRNIVSSVCVFFFGGGGTIKVKLMEVMSIKHDLWPRATRKDYKETFTLMINMAFIRLL